MRVLSLSFLVVSFLTGCGQAVFSGDNSSASEKSLSVVAGNEIASALLQDSQLCQKNGLVPKKNDCDSDSTSTDDVNQTPVAAPVAGAPVQAQDDDSSDDSSSDDDVVCTDLASCLKAKCEMPPAEAQPAAPVQ